MEIPLRKKVSSSAFIERKRRKGVFVVVVGERDVENKKKFFPSLSLSLEKGVRESSKALLLAAALHPTPPPQTRKRR
jgi:hypothetical protein